MGDLIDPRRPYQIVGLDTPIFVFHIEQSPRWGTRAGRVPRALADREWAGVTSVLTLLELAIKPRRFGRPAAADAYEILVQNIENLSVVGIDARVSRIGAELRAKHGLRTPDALQIAACLAHGAGAFVTNDRRLRRVNEIDVFVLDDFTPQ